MALHVATAVALLIFFRSEWVRIVRGFLTSLWPSIAARRLVVREDGERPAWLLVIATIPVGLTGVLLEHTFRTIFGSEAVVAGRDVMPAAGSGWLTPSCWSSTGIRRSRVLTGRPLGGWGHRRPRRRR